ncbi:MAG: SRPBCC family protein [Pseudomonadota bacterium]
MFIEARPEIVAAFLTDPTQIIRWMGTEAQLDAYPSGALKIRMGSTGMTAEGEFKEVGPERIVFTWGWQGGDVLPPGASTVEVTLTPEDGGTRLRLVHSGLPEDRRAGHGDGWTYHLSRLEAVAAGRAPGPYRYAD